MGYGGLLLGERVAGVAGGMEIVRRGRRGARREAGCEEDGMSGHRKRGSIAAFFDLDGTLIAPPSLERRFFASLRRHGALPIGNYFLWLIEALRLAPLGIQSVRQANKMYLRGILAGDDESRKSGQPEMAVPRFFPDGVDQVAWHARQGHAIVLVSGTLAPLAQEM